VARSDSEVFKKLHRKLKSLEQMRKKQEGLFLNHQIVTRDIEEIYGAIYLNAVASFESFIEELFIGLLVGRIHSKHSRVAARVTIKSTKVARDILLRGRNFFNWLPYDNTEKTARIFFVDGRPFTILTMDDKELLGKCLVIRNAIAHKSRYAVRKFSKEVLSNITLAPRDKRPKSFLRSQFSMSPPTNYYQHYVAETLKIAMKLC